MELVYEIEILKWNPPFLESWDICVLVIGIEIGNLFKKIVLSG